MRIAPYAMEPYKTDKYTVEPDAPKQVLVTGFDPKKHNLQAVFSSYGSIAELNIQKDPNTYSDLPICLIRYKDSNPVKGPARSAIQAAKDAESKAAQDWIGGTIRVQRDREGRLCRRRVDEYVKRKNQRPSVKPPIHTNGIPQAPRLETSIAPPNAPRGPSGRRPGEIPQTGPSSAIESPHSSVVRGGLAPIPPEPYVVMSYTDLPASIPFAVMKRHFTGSGYNNIVKCDVGWCLDFTAWGDTKHGEHLMKLFHDRFTGQELLRHIIRMKCVPDIVSRQPSSKQISAPAEQRVELPKVSPVETAPPKAEESEQDILNRERDEDFETEKKMRAEAADPVHLTMERIGLAVKDKLLESIMSSIVMPTFVDMLDPDRHRDKRLKLGLSDASSETMPRTASGLPVPSLIQSIKSPGDRRIARNGPLRPHDPNARRVQIKASTDAFEDSRRRRKPVFRAQGVGRRLQDMVPQDDSDSDEEKTPLTAIDHDNESRPLSRTSRTSTPVDDDTFDADMLTSIDTPPPEPAPVKPAAEREESADQTRVVQQERSAEPKFTSLVKELLGDCASKQPESMADKELAHTMSALDWQGPWSGFRKRCQLELENRKRAAQDDAIFRVSSITPLVESPGQSDLMDVDIPSVKSVKKRAQPKTKKPKKELAIKRVAHQATSAELDTKMEDAPEIETKDVKEDDDVEEEESSIKSRLPWALSMEHQARTFSDEPDVILDLDGWQHMIKDDEDLVLLKKALAKIQPAHIQDARYWAWKQKQIKTLNIPADKHDVLNVVAEISGYYVPNTTGCARTEGIQKILNSEKSKYLPHRIKVQKAREEREALAANKDAAQAEAAKQPTETFKTSSSRSNRVNNRRLVNDINLHKQHAPTSGGDTDAFRFNQLKKRKKHVRFDRSAIHGWGLYTEENIPSGDLIIEYVGEKLRQKVADMREIRYDRQGVGSSYLFRMAEDEIIDATKKGGIARFINHSCMPNCTAKIIKVEGTRRIVIYALKDISTGKLV